MLSDDKDGILNEFVSSRCTAVDTGSSCKPALTSVPVDPGASSLWYKSRGLTIDTVQNTESLISVAEFLLIDTKVKMAIILHEKLSADL